MTETPQVMIDWAQRRFEELLDEEPGRQGDSLKAVKGGVEAQREHTIRAQRRFEALTDEAHNLAVWLDEHGQPTDGVPYYDRYLAAIV